MPPAAMPSSSAPSSFIMLTPRGDEDLSAPSSPRVTRSRGESAKRAALQRSKTTGEVVKKDKDKDKKARDDASGSTQPTDTDQSSDVESAVDADDRSDLEVEDEFGVFPAYVCELHDPKSMLTAAHVHPDRVEIVAVNPPPVQEHRDKRHWGWSSNHTLCYEISVGSTSSRFECSPSKVFQAFKVLAADPQTSNQLRLIETDYFRGGFVGSFKRLYPSAVKLCAEIVELLEAISDIDAVLLHPTYLELVEVERGQAIYEELENLIQSHRHSAHRKTEQKCMCDVYQSSVERFGKLYKETSEEAAVVRHSVVASESFMQARSILSFFSDTMYVLDKRDFRPMRLNKCIIYGFGRRKLFEIVRVSRKRWVFRHVNHGTVATLSVERYMHKMNPYNMVSIKRIVPGLEGLSTREEEVCFVKKSKKHGYRCILMSEVISRGRVTTALSIEHTPVLEDDSNAHQYKTMSEISDLARESICSSSLSVPASTHKHFQQLRVSGGSDVITFLSLAVCYDMLVGSLAYMKERRY